MRLGANAQRTKNDGNFSYPGAMRSWRVAPHASYAYRRWRVLAFVRVWRVQCSALREALTTRLQPEAVARSASSRLARSASLVLLWAARAESEEHFEGAMLSPTFPDGVALIGRAILCKERSLCVVNRGGKAVQVCGSWALGSR